MRIRITQRQNRSFITGIGDGAVIGYKVFAFSGAQALSLELRGSFKGSVSVTTDEAGVQLCGEAEMLVSSRDWRSLLLPLRPRTRYYVRIEIAGDAGDSARAESFFETGKMGEPFTARWIGQQPGDAFHPVFFRGFSLKAAPVSARLYVTGLGLYEAYLNGEKVGSELLAPFCNDYNEAVQVQTYDVTAALREGDNRFEILCGNGWFKGRLGYEGAKTVMVGHIAQPAWVKKLNPAATPREQLRPASLSKELMTGLLRKELGFNGLIISDASHMIGMAGVMARKDAVPRCIAAGCDMFLFANDFAEDLGYLRAGYEQGIVTEERLSDALHRVLGLKAHLKLFAYVREALAAAHAVADVVVVSSANPEAVREE